MNVDCGSPNVAARCRARIEPPAVVAPGVPTPRGGMEPGDFDRLAHSAAGGLSRRRVMARLGVGGAASVIGAPGFAAAPTATESSLKIVGTVRLGSSADELLTVGSKKPGELGGELTFTPGEDGEIDKGELLLSDGKKLAVVGQIVGRAINLRVTLPDRRVVVLLGTAAEDLAICRGAVDGLLTGPEPGDIGDWHSTARANKAATIPAGSSSAGATATTGAGNGDCRNGQADCGKGCIDLLSDPGNCGQCDSPCGAGEICVNGACTGGDEQCDAGEITCSDTGCVDVATDINNCGQCGNACENPLICFNGLCCLAD